MDRTLLGILATFAAALAAVGLTFSRSTDAPADFRFVNETELKTLDPQLLTGHPEARVVYALFEGLTRFDAKTHRPAPGVAESWDVSPDGKKYTFHLRANARWSDGHPVTAGDFVYSWKRLLDPKLGSEYAYIVFVIRHAEAYNAYDSRAEELRGKVLPALAALPRAPAGDVDARAWQTFVSRNRVNDSIQGEASPRLVELLARREGRLARADLEDFRREAEAAAGRLESGAAAARAHFGIDQGVYAADDRTLVVELRAPTPYFLAITMFHTTLPSPRWLVEDPKRHDDWFLPEHIVTNGPYLLKRWLVNDRIRLERNELYWGRDEVRLRAIDAITMENMNTALNLYLTGAVDWLVAQHYPPDLVDDLKPRPDFYRHAGLIVYFYRLNVTRKPLDDRRVRQALNLAIDRRVIVEQVLRLGQIPAATFVPPGIPDYHPPDSPIRLDLDRARALLAEAGFPGGKGFPKLGILYNTNEAHKKIAEVIADQLRRNLGIEVSAYNQEWQSFLETVRGLDYDMARAAWVGDYVDPNTFLDMWVTNGGNNQTGWSSPLYDELIRTAADVSTLVRDPEPLLAKLKEPEKMRAVIERARSAVDPGARLQALAEVRLLVFREAEALLVQDEYPIIPVYFYMLGGLVRPYVKGFYPTLIFEDGSTAPNLQDLDPLRDIWVDRGAEAPR